MRIIHILLAIFLVILFAGGESLFSLEQSVHNPCKLE